MSNRSSFRRLGLLLAAANLSLLIQACGPGSAARSSVYVDPGRMQCSFTAQSIANRFTGTGARPSKSKDGIEVYSEPMDMLGIGTVYSQHESPQPEMRLQAFSGEIVDLVCRGNRTVILQVEPSPQPVADGRILTKAFGPVELYLDIGQAGILHGHVLKMQAAYLSRLMKQVQ